MILLYLGFVFIFNLIFFLSFGIGIVVFCFLFVSGGWGGVRFLKEGRGVVEEIDEDLEWVCLVDLSI